MISENIFFAIELQMYGIVFLWRYCYCSIS